MNSTEGASKAQGTGKLLKWAGSKSNVSSQITRYLDFDRDYIEPFCGSAAFFFEKTPKVAHLNDLNTQLIDFYKCVQVSPEGVWSIYTKIPVDEETYYETRRRFNLLPPSIERAAYFAYLNHFSFNGIYRTNKKGHFNTPFGAKVKQKAKLSLADFESYSKRMENAKLYSMDFEDFLLKVDPNGACIYMDPPYFTNEGRVFNEYGATPFSGEDLSRLHSISVRLSKKNKVAVSYRDCAEFRELFSDHILGPISVTRNVGGFLGRRKVEEELLAIVR